MAFLFAAGSLFSEVLSGRYDMAEVRDVSSLETRVIEDWHPWQKDPGIRQKLIEITVCEWWPGQKVRLPVTLIAPALGEPCANVIVGNMGMVWSGIRRVAVGADAPNWAGHIRGRSDFVEQA